METSVKRPFWTAEKSAMLAVVMLLLVFPEPAFAAQANVENMAQSILNLLTGTLAKVFATIGFVVCGYLYMMGRMSMQALVSVIVGCFIVFGAGWLVNLISG